MQSKNITYLLFLIIFTAGCGQGEPIFTPKPRAFPKITFPKKDYKLFKESFCDLEFEYPVYASIQKDTAFFEEKPANECWFDIYIEEFSSKIHCSYYPVRSQMEYEKLKNDAFELVDWHRKRANYIDEILIDKPNGVKGFAFDIGGPAASQFQFYLTDESNHFLRGALYFNTKAKPDSMAPIYQFVIQDVKKLIETFRWKK